MDVGGDLDIEKRQNLIKCITLHTNMSNAQDCKNTEHVHTDTKTTQQVKTRRHAKTYTRINEAKSKLKLISIKHSWRT